MLLLKFLIQNIAVHLGKYQNLSFETLKNVSIFPVDYTVGVMKASVCVLLVLEVQDATKNVEVALGDKTVRKCVIVVKEELVMG